MGYTHYWKLAGISQHSLRFAAVVKDMAVIVAKSPVPIAGWDGSGTPEFEEKKCSFNGVGKDSFESFCFPEGGFCKTGERPYDFVVVACLAVAADIFGTEINVRSDGNADDWAKGVAFATLVLGREIANPLAGKD